MLALVLVAGLSGCEPASETPDTVSPSAAVTGDNAPDLVFPLQPTASGMESRIDGTLIRKGRCLLVGAPGSRDRFLPFWPPGTTYQAQDGKIVILSDGVVTAREDEPISLDGGIPGSRRPASLRGEADGCPGTFWLVSVINR
jgi:hypothetical protein